MPLIDKESTHVAIREEYDRHKALYDLYHHTERGGIVQGLSYASIILAKQLEVPDIDRSAILRLCSEIEMIIVTVCDTGYTLQECDVEAIMKKQKQSERS